MRSGGAHEEEGKRIAAAAQLDVLKKSILARDIKVEMRISDFL